MIISWIIIHVKLQADEYYIQDVLILNLIHGHVFINTYKYLKYKLFSTFHWIILHIQEDEPQEDAKELQQGKPYHWRDWSIIRGRDCLYIWSDAAALELSNGSNGWFRFILDGKLATMYSSGSPEGGSDSSGNILFLQNPFTNFYNFDNLFYCSFLPPLSKE